MAGFVGILFVIMTNSKAVLDAQKAELEIEIAGLQKEKEVIESKVEETANRLGVLTQVDDLKKESEKAKAEIERLKEESEAEQAKFTARQRKFQNWDFVIGHYLKNYGKRMVPTHDVFVRESGIYTPSGGPISTADLHRWILEQVASEDETPMIGFWIENGANDRYVEIMNMLEAIPDSESATFNNRSIILPSGVPAGPRTAERGRQRGDE